MSGTSPQITYGKVVSRGRFTEGDAKGLLRVRVIKHILTSNLQQKEIKITCAMTDSKFKNVMKKLQNNDPQMLSEFEHKEVYGNVEEFQRRERSVEQDSDEGDEFDFNYRDEAIEWDGTPQNIDHESAKKRTDVFQEGDLRGDKNDLL